MIKGLNENQTLSAFNGIDDKFFGIIRTALKYCPDYIHFDWIESYYFRKYPFLTYISVPMFFIQLVICKYLLQIKIVWTLHNLIPHDKRQTPLKIFVQRRFARLVTFIRVLSPESVEAASKGLRIYVQKIKSIPTGSYTGYYPNETNKTESRMKLGLPLQHKILLTLGSLKSYKGIPELMNAFKSVDAPETILLIAGKSYDSNYLDKIESELTENIRLIEKFIDPDQLQYYYNAADLVILPFIEIENSGSVVMAMGFKKPIVAPLSNVIKYRLRYQTALLYQPGGLKAKLTEALAMTEQTLHSFGDVNYKQLSEHHWNEFGKMFK